MQFSYLSSSFVLSLVAVLSILPTSVVAFSVTTAAFPFAATAKASSPSSFQAIAGSDDEATNPSSRRGFLNDAVSIALVGVVGVLPANVNAAAADKRKVLVLGGTGFVGSRVVARLESLGVEVVATSRDGRSGTAALDFAATDAAGIAKSVQQLSAGCTAIVSCVGSIGTADDGRVNAGTGLAAAAARASGAKRFVYVSVAPEVRSAAGGVSFLQDYLAGKAASEDAIRTNFGNGGDNNNTVGYTLVAPTFIYGGDVFNVNPPRVAAGYGKLVEGLLSSGPFRAAASVTPGIISVALEPPIGVDVVAAAIVAAALSAEGTAMTLDTYDKIVAASKKVPL